MIHILISGVNGRLGQTLVTSIQNAEDMAVAAGVDIRPDAFSNDFPVYADFSSVKEAADVIIDFSRPDALPGLLAYASEHNIPAVLTTTGYTDTDKMMIAKYAGHIPLFYSANMSLGVNLQIELAKRAAEILADSFDIEIVEKHHNQKVDSPSGTALAIAEGINSVLGGSREFVFGRHSRNGKRAENEIGIHAVRGGTVTGEHDILFFGPDEVLEINHRAHSKQVFTEGAVRAARFIYKKDPALYSMTDLFRDIFQKI
ncbi:MAG TPA: 4-hydroxy-tetrahydrodipicolinate reductase [Clostridiales bacterium]|nr:4-hydroxy-tetrahydrodipicolinate reductase [Clostridiales bacterium]